MRCEMYSSERHIALSSGYLNLWLTKFVLGVRCSMQYPKSEASAGVKWVNRSQNGKKKNVKNFLEC